VAAIGKLKKSRFHTASVNPRRGRIIRTGPLNPNLPPLQTHPQAAAARQLPMFSRRNRLYFRLKAHVHVKSLQLGIV
jgi:hypothetical protein